MQLNGLAECDFNQPLPIINVISDNDSKIGLAQAPYGRSRFKIVLLGD